MTALMLSASIFLTASSALATRRRIDLLNRGCVLDLRLTKSRIAIPNNPMTSNHGQFRSPIGGYAYGLLVPIVNPRWPRNSNRVPASRIVGAAVGSSLHFTRAGHREEGYGPGDESTADQRRDG